MEAKAVALPGQAAPPTEFAARKELLTILAAESPGFDTALASMHGRDSAGTQWALAFAASSVDDVSDDLAQRAADAYRSRYGAARPVFVNLAGFGDESRWHVALGAISQIKDREEQAQLVRFACDAAAFTLRHNRLETSFPKDGYTGQLHSAAWRKATLAQIGRLSRDEKLSSAIKALE